MHWGHAVSKDLVSWEHLGISLFPTKREDQNGCFSGSAVVKDGRLYLAYTGVRYEEVNPEDVHTCLEDQFESAQMMISSGDGFHFDNWKDKRVIIPPITDPSIGHRTHTRDPKVWRGSDAWYMILGSTENGRQGKALFYRSEDLKTWKYVNQVGKGPDFGWMWECPDYFETAGGGVLLLSAMGFLRNRETEQNHTICFPVEFEESSCTMKIPDTWQFMDYGLDLYAPQTTLDEEGRRVLTAWVRMPEAVDGKWIGMFCAPRIVEAENGHVFFKLHPNIRNAYSEEISDVKEASPAGYRICLTLKEGERINIGGFLVYRNENRVVTDRSAVYPNFKGSHLVSETPKLAGDVNLEILVDDNLVEVFVNDGEYVISNAVYGLKREVEMSPSVKAVFTTAPEDVPVWPLHS